MALTYTPRQKMTFGAARANMVDITIGAAGDYSSGLTLTPQSLGLGTIQAVLVTGTNVIGATWFFDQNTGKLRGLKGNGVAEFIEVAGADISGDIVRVIAIGDAVNKG